MLVLMARASEWSARVAAWQASGLGAVEFSARHGYSAKLLQWWASQLRRRAKTTGPTSKRVRFAKVLHPASPVLASKPSPIVVRFERASVEVPAGADATTLGAVFDALRAGGAR